MIVCGLGHVGHRILCVLSRLGERGVVITRETQEEWRLAAEPCFPVLLGDARDEKLLMQAGIREARAILIVTDDDLANVSVALDARRLNPKIAIVMRLFDRELAVHLEKSMKISRALSASALAAPAFAAAALGETALGTFEVSGMTCFLEEHRIEEGSPWVGKTIEAWHRVNRLEVVARLSGKKTVFQPAADGLLEPGTRLIGLRLTNPRRRSDGKAGKGPFRRRRPGSWRAAWAGIGEWWRDAPGALRFALVALFHVVILSVVLFHYYLGLAWVDAFYFVIATVATVGYGDFNLMNAPPWIKLYGSLVILSGAATLAILFSIMTDLMLGTRLRDVLARGCSRFKGHIIVAGLGDIGFRLVRALVGSGETVVAIGAREDGEFVQTVREIASVVIGNPQMEETLRKAGVSGAKAILAVTDDDLANLSIGLAGKRADSACRVVLRIFDDKLEEKIRHDLHIDAIQSVSGAAAPTFVGAVFCPEILQGILLPDSLMLVRHQVIPPGPPTQGAAAGEEKSDGFPALIKKQGEKDYESYARYGSGSPGDEVIGIQWIPFPDPAEVA